MRRSKRKKRDQQGGKEKSVPGGENQRGENERMHELADTSRAELPAMSQRENRKSLLDGQPRVDLAQMGVAGRYA
ncbi:hypothetical protein EJ08DRAFT_646937 [Tothia fuscella]|uniref:Uncharacterized protein n=1 Tax=Tothia fuscella TaxID=1048955 RepID=A0A9P4NYN0_9PEZI|nr:hypothetical protein EJ08DRAFT_646937 [Tothia fuscella]